MTVLPRLCLLLCLALSTLPAARAQPIRFTALGVEQGLPNPGVIAIAQDRRGFMWFGTLSGLARYDGYQSTVYRPDAADPHALASGHIAALHADAAGQLWIGTAEGLHRYDPVNDRFERFPAPCPPAQRSRCHNIWSLAGDGRGGLWIGSREGLQHFDPGSGSWRFLRHDERDPASLSDNKIAALAVDPSGALWVGTAAGLDRLARGAQRFEHVPVAAGKPVWALLATRGGQLWVASADGLASWPLSHPEQRRRYGARDGLGSSRIGALAEDATGRVWLGTDAEGAARWDPAAARFVRHTRVPTDPHSLSSNVVSALYQGRDGTFWAGTFTAGVNKADLATGGIEQHAPFVGSPNSIGGRITGILESAPGEFWVTSFDEGLARWSPAHGLGARYRHRAGDPASLPGDDIAALARDHAGTLWIATLTGLARFDPATGKARQVPLPGGALGNRLRSVMIDRAGAAWVGGLGVLHRFAPDGRRTSYRHQETVPDGLGPGAVNAVLEGRDGRYWIGTTAGLDRLDPATGRFEHFSHDPARADSLAGAVVQLLEDSRGRIWLAAGGALDLLEPGPGGAPRFRHYGRANGLQDSSVASLAEGADGRIWLATDSTVAVLDAARGQLTNYDADAGVQQGGFYDRVALRAANGDLYFGGPHGLTRVRPAAIRANPHPPQPALTAVSVLNQPLTRSVPPGLRWRGQRSAPSAIELGPDVPMFTIEFAGLHYAEPRHNQYLYRLDGWDRDWIAADAGKRSATYTNLDPGTYLFRVRAANKDGRWSADEARMQVVVVPPFWKSRWFRALATLALAALAIGIYYRRLARLNRNAARLEREVAERTRELRDEKEKVEQSHRQLQDAQQQLVLQAKMTSLGTLTAGVAHEINNPANFAHVGAQVLGREIEALRQTLVALAGDDGAEDGVAAMLNRRCAALQAQAATILSGTSRIRDLVKDLRTFSRLDEAERKVVSIEQNIVSTVQLVRTKYADIADIRLELADAPPIGCWPAQLNQVFMNLIVNACQAIEAKRSSAADARGLLSIRSRSEEPWLVLEFEDEGCGMPAAVAERVFEPFYSTKPEGEGTGLGLSISFGIIRKHGGEISLRSHEGVGTCVTLRLPLAGVPA